MPPTSELDPPPPFDPRQPFSRAQGVRAGLTDYELRTSAYVRLFHDVYLARDAPRTLASTAHAALLHAPRSAVVSHETAAVLWGGVVPPTSSIHLTVPPHETYVRVGVRTHRLKGERPILIRHGLPLTSPEQTFIDLAGRLDLVQLVTLGDRLVGRGVTSPAALESAARQWPGRYRSSAQQAARLVRPGVDSPPESRLRLLIVLAGLPEPTVNHVVRDPDTGSWLRRFELAYPDLRIAIEYEGRQHRDDDEIWASDIERREELDRDAWRVIQVISPGLYEAPLRTIHRIQRARVDRGAAPTRVLSEDWRRYFPGRAAA
ncbi:MAG TPA: hypothetical protein VFT68_08780 [Lapillicoccus sp.]|nr:hypothetical protein [Lapillicoccus sp.]